MAFNVSVHDAMFVEELNSCQNLSCDCPFLFLTQLYFFAMKQIVQCALFIVLHHNAESRWDSCGSNQKDYVGMPVPRQHDYLVVELVHQLFVYIRIEYLLNCHFNPRVPSSVYCTKSPHRYFLPYFQILQFNLQDSIFKLWHCLFLFLLHPYFFIRPICFSAHLGVHFKYFLVPLNICLFLQQILGASLDQPLGSLYYACSLTFYFDYFSKHCFKALVKLIPSLFPGQRSI